MISPFFDELVISCVLFPVNFTNSNFNLQIHRDQEDSINIFQRITIINMIHTRMTMNTPIDITKATIIMDYIKISLYTLFKG